MSRKLASLRFVTDIKEAKGLDNLEHVCIGGWKVLEEKGKYTIGDKVIFCEIDSMIPLDKRTEHLTKYSKIIEVEDKKYIRVKTAKIRGNLSQGVLLNPQTFSIVEKVDSDLTEILGIRLYEPINQKDFSIGAVDNQADFPYFIMKTDQERIQNIKEVPDFTYEVTEKIDGTSCTMFVKDGDFGICSRNFRKKTDAEKPNGYTKIYYKYIDILSKWHNQTGRNIALQGELIGLKIQGNPYNLQGQEWYIFDIFDIDKQEYLMPEECRNLCEILGLNHVPVISEEYKYTTFEDELKNADGISKLYSTKREGLVFKANQPERFSFKIVSNRYLLKNDL